MSLDKAIEHGKEKRKPHTGGKAVDNECRNHGSCSWCRENRLHSIKIQEESADARLEEYRQEESEETIQGKNSALDATNVMKNTMK